MSLHMLDICEDTKSMPWHPFQPDEVYTVDEILAVLRRRLHSGYIIAVPAKSAMVDAFARYHGTDLIWKPFASWGSSPFNHRAWKRTDGSDFTPA